MPGIGHRCENYRRLVDRAIRAASQVARASDLAVRIMLWRQRLRRPARRLRGNLSRQAIPSRLTARGDCWRRCDGSEPGLQRLDFHLAELHHALVIHDAFVVLDTLAVLEGDPSAGKLGVLRGIDGFLPVENHGEC
jgi:hypothetical protein